MSILKKLELAHNINTPPYTLRILATDTDYWVRAHVAHNTKTPRETLMVLATDEKWEVRQLVGTNPNSTELIKRLVLMTNHKENNQL
jgi:hypothetical protein